MNPVSATMVDAGGSFSLALMQDGSVWSWGYNQHGRLGDGTFTKRYSPVKVSGLNDVIEISAGGSHSLALQSDGTVWSWGNNKSGQIGDGTTVTRNTPVKVIGPQNIIAISAGRAHSMALRSDGTVWTWGNNYNGRLGDGTIEKRHQPVQVTGLSNIIAVSAGGSHSLALQSDGTVWAWGSNSRGQLGNGSYWGSSYTPVQTSELTDVIAISAGSVHSLALLPNGTVWSWGENYSGQLGIGTLRGKQPLPVQVNDLVDVVAISSAGKSSIVLKSDGTAWGWGYNYYGQIGDGTTDRYKSKPTMISGLNDIKSISISGMHSLAVKQDGTVWAWGFNQTGQIGDSTTVDRHTPVQCLFKLESIKPDDVSEIDARINQAIITPEDLEVGDKIAIQVNIENTGNVEHQFDLVGNLWKPNNNSIEPDEVFTAKAFLEQGDNKTISWNYIVDVAGEWNYEFTVWKEQPYIEKNMLHKYPKPTGLFYVSSEEYIEHSPDGAHKIAYIPVKFPDSRSPQPTRTVANLKTWAGMAAGYFQQQSFGMIEIESHFVANDWIVLDKSLAEYQKEAAKQIDEGNYPDGWRKYFQSNKVEYLTDLMIIQDAMEKGNSIEPGKLVYENYANWSTRSGEIKLGKAEGDRYYDIVAVIQPGNNTSYNGISISDFGFLALNDIFGFGVWAHELGHGILGFKDYNARETYGSIQSWGLMGYGCYLNPPAPIMSFNKVSEGWLDYSHVVAGNEEPVMLYHEMQHGDSVLTFEPTKGNIGYYIIEGRSPPDGMLVGDPWHEKPYKHPEKLYAEKGILLYKVIEKVRDDNNHAPHIYTIPNASWSIVGGIEGPIDLPSFGSVNHRKVTLKPGESYIDDLSEVIFTANEVDSLLYLNVEEQVPYNRNIINYTGNNLKDTTIIADNKFTNVSASFPPLENEFDIDLKVYSADGMMVGMCYDTDKYLVEIPGARASGNIGGGGPEWISVPDDIEIYYEIDTSPIENWLDELIKIGIIEPNDMEDLELEIEAIIQEIVVDEHGERDASEVTETLNIAYNNPLESNNISEGINFLVVILTTIFLLLITVSIIVRGIMRDRVKDK